jgi:eukaryotic-like serine/threonine-protein kinase
VEKTSPVRVRLGAFEVHLRAGELRANGSSLRLQDQPFRILEMLIEQAGGVVTREAIQKKLWPNDTIVEFDHSINTAIKKLRRAFGDSAECSRYVETVARRGYRLLVPVEWLSEDPDAEPTPVSLAHPAIEDSLSRANPNRIGRRVSHYRVLEVIGGGGMGLVYKAEDLKLGRPVALKFLPEELGEDAISLHRFKREARTASSLNHPNICTIYGVEEDDQQPFIAMELLEGETLRDRLARHVTALPVDEILDIAIQTCNGLQAAHEKGIIHRDIKPANIFLTASGLVKILDFGLAKLAGTDGLGEELEQRGLVCAMKNDAAAQMEYSVTGTGAAMGTAGYMSPEQLRGEKLDPRTDLFSFGLVLYEMATGRRAFSGNTAAVRKDAILNHTPAQVRELTASIPPKLERIIHRAMEKERSRRYESAAQMHLELAAVPGRGSILRTHWRSLSSAAAILILAASAMVYWFHLKPTSITPDDTIVLGNFSNSTGDAIFDGTLRQALDLELQQSPRISVLSERKVSEALTSLHRSPADVLTPALARQVCVETQSRAVLNGSIANHGNRYPIQLIATDCMTGKTLASAAGEAANRADVIHALGQAGARLRKNVGDSSVSIADFNRPLESATTSSLDALQEYAKGVGTIQSSDPESHLKRAAELDPNFALVYQQLGRHYMAFWQSALAAESFTKAYALRDRLSLRHSLPIEASYYLGASGELDKSVQTFNELLRTFPESGARNQLCFVLRVLGRLEEAVTVCREAVRLIVMKGLPSSTQRTSTSLWIVCRKLRQSLTRRTPMFHIAMIILTSPMR